MGRIIQIVSRYLSNALLFGYACLMLAFFIYMATQDGKTVMLSEDNPVILGLEIGACIAIGVWAIRRLRKLRKAR